MLFGRADGNAIRGKIIGRLSLTELCVAIGGGWTFVIKVPDRVGEQVSIGDQTEVVIDAKGRPKALRPFDQSFAAPPQPTAEPDQPRPQTPPAGPMGDTGALPG